MSTNLVPISQKVWSDVPTPPRRELLWIKEGRICHWCKQPTRYHPLNPDGSYNPQAWDMATIDHVLPRFKGGSDDESNLVSACRLCNNRRSHEDNCGFPDGSLLGKFDPEKGIVPQRTKKKKAAFTTQHVALTGDEKRAILGTAKTPNSTASVPAIDAVRIQRDQALSRIAILRKERDAWEPVVTIQATQIKELRKQVEDQEEELKALKSLTVWQFVRKKLAAWLAP